MPVTNTLKIDTGEVRLLVNDDPTRSISFNPKDLGFAERFYALAQDYQEREKEYKRRAEELTAKGAEFPESAALIREIAERLKEKLDDVFGAGTSEAAFGAALTLDMFAQFFEGVTPFIESARADKIGKYTKSSGGVMK